VQNLIGIDLAVMLLHIDENFMWICLFTYPSLSLSVSCSWLHYSHSFMAILMLSGSNDMFSQPLLLSWGYFDTAPQQHLLMGSPPPQKKNNNNNFWSVNRRFQAKCAKY